MKLALLQVVLVIVFCAYLASPAEKEAPKPYQFGFNIGTQHREEKKDENGIVVGEYGFLTADGYYNTVMYATDIEGRFLITGRKRVKVTTTTPKPKVEVEGRKGRANTDFTPPTTTERTLTYKFNYTAPQHGRKEMGFSDSSKVGDYYWDGPDGYRRIVTYNADDEKGYRPIIKQVKLPIK